MTTLIPFPVDPTPTAQETALLLELQMMSASEQQFVAALTAVLAEHGVERAIEICALALTNLQEAGS